MPRSEAVILLNTFHAKAKIKFSNKDLKTTLPRPSDNVS